MTKQLIIGRFIWVYGSKGMSPSHHGGKAWQQVGMVAQGKGESSYHKLQTQSRVEQTRNDGGH